MIIAANAVILNKTGLNEAKAQHRILFPHKFFVKCMQPCVPLSFFLQATLTWDVFALP